MDKLEVISALKALAQESRIEIFKLLIKKGASGMMVGAIGKELNLPHATLSFHLDKLKQAGLIDCYKDGRATIYHVNYECFVGSIRYLTENCCNESDMSCEIVVPFK